MTQLLQPAPKPDALAGGGLYDQVDQAAQHDQGQAHVHQRPEHHHERHVWFFETVAHHGVFFSAQAEFVQHGARILGR
jgi:hypothetical protein